MAKHENTLTVPNGYFLTMAKADYRNYRTALPREFYQNSIDAGATEIEVKFVPSDRRIDIIDDGSGMKRPVLAQLLTLGGSYKDGDDAVGGFGKAKDLLYFSWTRYQILTDRYKVTGKGAGYTIESNEFVQGTRASIWIPKAEDMDQLRACFALVAAKMEVPCKISVDGEIIKTKITKGNGGCHEFDWAKLHINEEVGNDPHMHFRINGVWMFSEHIGDIGARLTLELSKNSVECLNSNRDSLKERYAEEVAKLTRKISADRKAILNPPKVMISGILNGTGKVHVNATQSSFRAGMVTSQLRSDILPETKKGLASMVTGLASLMEGVSESVAYERIMIEAKEIFDNGGCLSDTEVDTAKLNFVGYKPDFFVSHEVSDEDRVQKFLSSKYGNVLAEMWTEIVKQILLDDENYISFTAGFDFDDDRAASFRMDSTGNVVVSVNPDKILGGSKTPMKKRWMLVEYLKEMALHELAHMKYRYHDEEFVGEMSRLRFKTMPSHYAYKAIQKLK
jgi:hypothetical protein